MRSPGRPPEEGARLSAILVPTDGSRGAWRGTEHALDIAARDGAIVHVLHVVDERTVGGTPALSSDELAIEKAEEEAERMLAEVVAAAEGKGVETVLSCMRGVPHAVILQYATEHRIDLIVMGTHGTTRTARPHVGSTTDRVAHTSVVPVLPV